MRRVGFTGTRAGMTTLQRVRVLELLSRLAPGERFHHGDCIGADKEAHDTARSCGLLIEAHPSTLDEFRAFTDADVVHQAKPPLDRNRDIVDAVELLVAAPRGPGTARTRSACHLAAWRVRLAT